MALAPPNYRRLKPAPPLRPSNVIPPVVEVPEDATWRHDSNLCTLRRAMLARKLAIPRDASRSDILQALADYDQKHVVPHSLESALRDALNRGRIKQKEYVAAIPTVSGPAIEDDADDPE